MILLKNNNNFDNDIELFLKKIKSGEMKLEDAKKPQNIIKSNLKEISKGIFKCGLENISLLLKSRQAIIKLYNDYFSETKDKVKYGGGLKILSPK